MTIVEYGKILECLGCVTRTLAANQGELCESDLRIRGLISTATTEVERRLQVLLGQDGHGRPNDHAAAGESRSAAVGYLHMQELRGRNGGHSPVSRRLD
jgi:hypothetical protein